MRESSIFDFFFSMLNSLLNYYKIFLRYFIKWFNVIRIYLNKSFLNCGLMVENDY